ncbi:MAG: hypothetical protein FJ077_14010, partial [Cyanobacteria bacterium K_DeepCast_35m_m2_023]|nr:hypothetical protein [Cyanobacteria bacterium K_DeepCast_35m_m2_023]
MIHFHLTRSRNYSGVQRQLLDLIKAHLPAKSWTESDGYVKGKLNFSLFIHQKSDVLMSHGAADKNYHFRRDPDDKTKRLNHTMGRTDLLVPGTWLQRRIADSGAIDYNNSNVHVVGWPRLDPLLELQKQANQEAASKSRRKRILWAPTHDYARRGENNVSLSSYPEFEPFLKKLSERYVIATSLHPRNRKSKTPTSMALAEADVVVSDFGTIVYEAIALDKQVIFPSWIIGERIRKHLKASAEHHIFTEGFGLHASSFDDLCDMIETGRSIDMRSKAFFDSFLPPETYGHSAKMVADTLL